MKQDAITQAKLYNHDGIKDIEKLACEYITSPTSIFKKVIKEEKEKNERAN